mgnify:CR=1 FL=1
MPPQSSTAAIDAAAQSRPGVTTPAAAPAAMPRWQRQLPNALTILRLVIALGFFTLLSVWTYPARDLVVTPRHPVLPYLVAAALFGLAAVPDAIDGPLARRWKVVSRFGRVMDPFADKVLVVGAFVMLAGPQFGASLADDPYFQVSGVQSWMVVLILGRELLVTSIRAVLESEGRDFSAAWSGKAKMVVQATGIPLILVVLGFTEVGPNTFGRWAIDIVVWLTVAITIVSGIPYVAKGLTAFADSKPTG